MVPVPGVLYFVIVGLVTAGMLVPFAVDRLLFQRFDGLPRTLILPTALVSTEFLTPDQPLWKLGRHWIHAGRQPTALAIGIGDRRVWDRVSCRLVCSGGQRCVGQEV